MTALALVVAVCQVGTVAGAEPATATAARKHPAAPIAWVYHEGRLLWPGDYSFSAAPFYADTSGEPLSGTYDIKVSLTGPWGGFQPFARNWDFDAHGYAYLTFALKTTVANQSLQIFFEKLGDVPVGVTLNPLKYGPAPVVGQWTTYKIPLADLGVTGRIFKFAIQDQTGLKSNVFYLDDIGFLPPAPEGRLSQADEPPADEKP